MSITSTPGFKAQLSGRLQMLPARAPRTWMKYTKTFSFSSSFRSGSSSRVTPSRAVCLAAAMPGTHNKSTLPYAAAPRHRWVSGPSPCIMCRPSGLFMHRGSRIHFRTSKHLEGLWSANFDATRSPFPPRTYLWLWLVLGSALRPPNRVERQVLCTQQLLFWPQRAGHRN